MARIGQAALSHNERAARASIFRAALEDGVLGECLTEIEQQFVDEWKRSQTADERDNCWRSVRIIQLLKQNMGAIAAGERDSLTAIRRVK